MSLRQEALRKLHEQASNGGISLQVGGGKEARQRVTQASGLYAEARQRLLEHELATHFRIAIFGSARLGPESEEYSFTADLAKALVASTDADIVTGAGPGIMEAALFGASLAVQEAEAGGEPVTARRVGIGIQLPHEQSANPHVQVYSEHQEFTTRLQEFVDMTHAAYFAPGGIGTALELMTIMQLKQIGHLERDYPIVVHPFWRNTIEAMQKEMYDDRVERGQKPLMNQEDLHVIYSDNVEEVVRIMAEHQRKWHQAIGQHVRRDQSS